jgi:pimeloyl-ACP methyl ester carboxylesterase
MGRQAVGQIALNVEVAGSGPPLVLVHGFPLDHQMWQAQIEGLADAYQVIAPDLRGFGGSDVTRGTVTMPQMADDLAGLLDVLQVRQPVTLAGLSMGGYVAWQFALRHRPRLARLILCDTRAQADTPEAAAARLALAERVLAEGAAVVAQTLLPKLFAPATYTQKPELVAAMREVILRTHPEGIAAALRGMAQRPDVRPLLGQIDVPALVLGGEEDAISPPDEMRQIARELPQGTWVPIPHAGHMAPCEQPDRVNQAIRRFLAAS